MRNQTMTTPPRKPGRPWISLDCTFLSSDEAQDLMAEHGTAGPMTFVSMIMWSRLNNRDGQVPAAALPTVTMGFGLSGEQTQQIMDSMVELGLIVIDEDARRLTYEIKSYATWQQTTVQSSKTRAAAAERQRRKRARDREQAESGTPTPTGPGTPAVDTVEERRLSVVATASEAVEDVKAAVKATPSKRDQRNHAEDVTTVLTAFNTHLRDVVGLPQSQIKDNTQWRNAIRLLLDQDGATVQEVLDTIEFLKHAPTNGNFCWRDVVRSAPALREKWHNNGRSSLSQAAKRWFDSGKPAATAHRPGGLRGEQVGHAAPAVAKTLDNVEIVTGDAWAV